MHTCVDALEAGTKGSFEPPKCWKPNSDTMKKNKKPMLKPLNATVVPFVDL